MLNAWKQTSLSSQCCRDNFSFRIKRLRFPGSSHFAIRIYPAAVILILSLYFISFYLIPLPFYFVLFINFQIICVGLIWNLLFCELIFSPFCSFLFFSSSFSSSLPFALSLLFSWNPFAHPISKSLLTNSLFIIQWITLTGILEK